MKNQRLIAVVQELQQVGPNRFNAIGERFFVGPSRLISEYPEADVFGSTKEAETIVRRLAPNFPFAMYECYVISDYGHDNERIQHVFNP